VDGAIGKRAGAGQAQAVATVVYPAASLANIERAFGFLRKDNPGAAIAAAAAIASAVDHLAMHPLIGRRVSGEIRELVVSYGQSGHIALYRFDVLRDEVRVLALRHQRELGYQP